jgi:CRP-like cAMP-binding protein
MSDSARFALHRPEHHASLLRGEDKIAKLMAGTEQTLPAGHILVKAHTEHEFVYRLLSGWVCRSRMLPDARDQFILVFLPGDLFAVKSMFVTRHTDDIRLLSKAVVQRLHYRELHRAYLEDGDVANRCTWQVVEEERRLHNWVVGLGLGSAEERLGLLLIDFHGRLTVSGSIAADALSFPMPLTQAQLADHIGMTPVHVNRVLKSFRDRGIVSVRDGEVTISDLAKLRDIAYPLLDTYEKSRQEYVGSDSSAGHGAQQLTRS